MGFIKALFSLILLAVVLAGAAIVGGWVWFQNEVRKEGPHASDVVFHVEAGEGLNAVAQRLETEGLIRDARLLRLAGRTSGRATDIKAGEFEIPARASAAEVLNALVEGKAVLYKLTVPEGLTTAQALRLVEASGELTGPMPETAPPEGALLPDTYLFPRGMSRADAVQRMIDAQDELLASAWPERQDGLPFDTPYEAVILASVVEKETGTPDEQPTVAGLFVNRLKKSMRLQSDPTIIYGVSGGEPLFNSKGQRRTLYRSEIDRVTDWNTYQIDGLPKTPICNPGRDAILAVLNPPDTDYLYFVADGSGGHRFATTLAEHNRNVAAYRAYEREEIARERSGE